MRLSSFPTPSLLLVKTVTSARNGRITARTPVKFEERNGGLDGLLHHPGTQTASTHTNTLGGAIDHRADALKIGSEDAVRLIVGMADIMPGLMTLATNLTYKGHDPHSFSTDSLY
jgi:hypothetical protein